MVKTSRPQALSSSSWPFCCSSGTVPFTGERCWTAKEYLTLSLQSPGTNIDCLTTERASSSIWASHHSGFSLQGSRDGPKAWQGRPIYDGPKNYLFVASSRARYASCWNESCRKHASGSYTATLTHSPGLEAITGFSNRVGTLARHFAMGSGQLAGFSAITDSSTLSPRSRAKSSKLPGLTHKSPKECFWSLANG